MIFFYSTSAIVSFFLSFVLTIAAFLSCFRNEFLLIIGLICLFDGFVLSCAGYFSPVSILSGYVSAIKYRFLLIVVFSWSVTRLDHTIETISNNEKKESCYQLENLCERISLICPVIFLLMLIVPIIHIGLLILSSLWIIFQWPWITLMSNISRIKSFQINLTNIKLNY
jgi:hypothetical protein